MIYNIAEVLDNTWWTEEVAVGLPNREKNIGTEEEPDMVAKTWEEYCLVSNGVDKNNYIIRDEEDNIIKEFVRFNSGSGGDFALPNGYSSNKLRTSTQRELNIYQGNKFLIHLFTDLDINTNPKDIDWKTSLDTRLTKEHTYWAGVKVKSVYSYNGSNVLERVFIRTYVNRKVTQLVEKIYWYRANSSKEQLKPDLVDTFDSIEQLEFQSKQISAALKGAFAWAVSNGYQTEASALWAAGDTEYNESIKFGSDAFRQFIIGRNDAFLSDAYSNELKPDLTTIKDALVSYLTFE